MIDGIVFDFNGTLLWDMDLHRETWEAAVRRVLGRTLSDDDWHHHLVGRTNAEIWPYLAGRPLDAAQVQVLGEQKEEAYRDLLRSRPDRLHLVDGAVELFELCLAEGLQIGIGTAAGQANKDFYVEVFGLHRWFRPERIVYDDGTRPGKPHPALFAMAMERLGVEPGRCLIVEDGLLGIRAARAAGAAKVYGIWATEEDRQQLATVPLDRVIHTYREMGRDDFR